MNLQAGGESPRVAGPYFVESPLPVKNAVRKRPMWRSITLAIGISLCILGAEFMVVDRLVLNNSNQTSYSSGDSSLAWGGVGAPSRRAFVPPEWAPWGLVSGGVVVILYSSAISGRTEE
jgi:hypothetical protein